MKPALRHLATLTAAAACLLLSSCIDVEQDIWINADGSGRIRIDMGVSKQAEEMMSGFGESLAEGLGAEKPEEAGSLFDVEEIQAQLDANELIKSAKVTTSKDDTYTRIIYDIQLVDITKLSQVQDAVFADGPMGGGDAGGGGPTPEGDFSVIKLPNGNYKFMATLEGEQPDEGEDPPNAMALGMMKKMFGDAAFTFRVHAKAVKHNGTAEGGAIVWSIPLADIATGKTLNINAEFSPGGSGGMALWITLGAILAVAVVLFFLLQSQKPKLA